MSKVEQDRATLAESLWRKRTPDADEIVAMAYQGERIDEDRLRDGANCKDIIPLVHSTARSDVKQVMARCAECPVRALCLAKGLQYEGRAGRHQRFGIWGGENVSARWAIAHENLSWLNGTEVAPDEPWDTINWADWFQEWNQERTAGFTPPVIDHEAEGQKTRVTHSVTARTMSAAPKGQVAVDLLPDERRSGSFGDLKFGKQGARHE